MANIFTIRHGNGNPGNNLKQYELGYSDNEQRLYIGNSDGAIPIYATVKNADTKENLTLSEYQLGFNNAEEQLYIGIQKNGEIKLVPISTAVEVSNTANGKFVYYGNNKLQASDFFVLGEENFGSELPTENLVEGRMFVLLEEGS